MPNTRMKANLTARPTKLAAPARAKRPKLTPWFPASVKPKRVGLYRVKWRDSVEAQEWCWWSGRRWAWSFANLRDALADKTTEEAHQEKRWRGLASNPASNKGEQA